MKPHRVGIFGTVAAVLLICAVAPSRSADSGKDYEAIGVEQVVKDSILKKKLPKSVAVGSGEGYYGTVRVFGVGSQNTFTFWVYGSTPPPVYNAYTFSLSDPDGDAMREAVMYAAEHKVGVGVFTDDTGRPTLIVVYP